MSSYTRADYGHNTGHGTVGHGSGEEQSRLLNDNVGSAVGEEQREGQPRQQNDDVGTAVEEEQGEEQTRWQNGNVRQRSGRRHCGRRRGNKNRSPHSVSESQISDVPNDSVQRRTWLLILFIIMNIFLLLVNTFQIYFLEYSNAKWWKYSPVSAALVFVILIFIYVWLCHSAPRNAPLRGRQTTALVGVFITGAGVFTAIELYLYLKAAAEFHDTIWQSIPNYTDDLVAPSFAIIRGERDAAYADFEESWPKKCSFPDWGGIDCSDSFVDQGDFTSAIYGKLHYKLFEAAKNQPPITISNLSEKVLLQTFVTYDSSAIESNKGGYDTRAPQNPYLLFAVYDPYLPSFTQALECGIIHLTEIPALGANTLTITPYVMSDDVGAVKPSNEKLCGALTHYTYYNTMVSSTGTVNSTACDTSSLDYQEGYACISQVTLRYSTFLDTQFKSMRKLSKQQIYIDEGGIAGGVIFLTWFLSIFIIW